MRKLDITPITDAGEFPVKKGTLQFLQDSYAEILSAIMQALTGPNTPGGYDPSKVYAIFGVLNSGISPIYNITSGCVFYNGELFLVDMSNFSLSGVLTAVMQIVITPYTTDADPVQFTDTVSHNVHNIRKVSISAGASGSGISDYSQLVFLKFGIPPATTVAASPNANNVAQVLGAYPNYQIYVPAPSGWKILYQSSFVIGAVGVTGTVLEGNGASSYNVTFPNVGRSDYNINHAVLYNSGNAESQAAIGLAFSNLSNSGFTVVFKKKDPSSGTTDLVLQYSLTCTI